jgi:spore maturation protein CgeB
MRIAYVASRWDYGDPRRGLSHEETNFRSALEGMGHEVHAYDFPTRLGKIGRDAMNRELAAFIMECSPDIAVFILFKDEIARETIEKLTADGILTFNWFCDDHWRFDDFSRYYAPAFSLVSTTDREALAKYAEIGCPNVVLTQWACNEHAYSRLAPELVYDISLVGQRYGDRPKIVKRLRGAGFDVSCWGQGWDAGRLEHYDMVKTFGASRINLNIAGAYAGRLWRRRPLVSQIKARPFEVAGSGGFVLSEYAPHLEEYFDIGREIAVFRSETELIEQAHYWLTHERDRVRVAERGYARVLRDHTYAHRFDAIFAAAGLQ